MGEASSSSSSSSRSENGVTKTQNNNNVKKSRSRRGETQVIINVYDLTPVNNYALCFGFGVFHSGIQVHGTEYGFGAHDYPISGVFEVEPKKCPGFIYRCSIAMGRINMAPSDFRTFIQSVASEYHGDKYHLINNNCNHFTDDIAWRVTGRRIPAWVNRLARLGSFCSCLVPESLQVTTVRKLPEYHHNCADDDDDDEEDSSRASTSTPQHTPEMEDMQERKLLPCTPRSNSSTEVAFIKEVNNPNNNR